jgi:hypothetical protein
MIEIVLVVAPLAGATPLAVFTRRLLKALLRSAGWRCERVEWRELEGKP